MSERFSRGRRAAIVCAVLFFFAIIVGDLFKLQIVEGAKYDAVVSAVSSRTASIPSTRGEIVDSNGKKLVYNEPGVSVCFDAAYFPKEQKEQNEIILSLVKLFEKNKIEWNDKLPLILYKDGVIFKDDSEDLIDQMKSRKVLNLNKYTSAQECFDALVEEFELEEYSKNNARKIGSVLFEMKREEFSIGVPYVFATDVPEEIAAAVMEKSSFYKGVQVEFVPHREYTDGTIAPHILGMTGAITAERYAELKEKGYKMSDIVGISGIELAMEDYLKGTDGQKTVYTDSEGNRTEEITQPAKQGNTVVLTIDAGMQKVAQDALKQALEDYAGKEGNMVPNAGAVVVLSCKDSAVLACASYPTYDISTYTENAEKLNKALAAPLWNRALMSAYATGSTAKPSVAIAALEEGIIDEKFTVYCSGHYTYLGQEFKCEQAHESAYVNVVNAIDESCNTFFLEVGRMLGIEKMNEYRNLLGLGAKTGCELKETTGILDSPEYRSSLGQEWLPGFTVQSAIGQAGNLWTPIQLANYVNTIANGGTRYKTHFVKSIKSADYSETVMENTAEVMCRTGISEETLDIVKRGMREVGVSGYCASYFRHLPVEVAAKTGTSQEYRIINGYSTKINNGFLIAFAPYDNPEIAIAAVGEGMYSGKFVAPVIAAIVEYYCGFTDDSPEIDPAGELIP